MTQTEIDYLKDYLDRKFDDFTDRHKTLKTDIDEIKLSVPRIAYEKAKEAILKNSFLTPSVKVGIATFALTVLALLFSIYGKQTTALAQFDELRSDIKSKQVIENAVWVSENKNNITKEFKLLNQTIKEMQYEIMLIKNRRNIIN